MSDMEKWHGEGWGTSVEIPREELDKIMQRIQRLGDPFDAMESLLDDKTFPNDRVDIVHFIRLSQIANDEVQRGTKTAAEAFARWEKANEEGRKAWAALNLKK